MCGGKILSLCVGAPHTLTRTHPAKFTARTAQRSEGTSSIADLQMQWLWDLLAPQPPSGSLEPAPDVAQCNYELLRAFSQYAARHRFRFSLASGTLLGAMRNEPSGLLQWEHDVDVYMPARDAALLAQKLRHECERSPRIWNPFVANRWCETLLVPHGLTDRTGKPCCGFGFKIFHRRRDTCELDVLVLSVAHGPYMHGETWTWPFWAPVLAKPYSLLMRAWHWIDERASSASSSGVTSEDGTHSEQHDQSQRYYYVIPEDVPRKSLIHDTTRWCQGDASGEWRWCGGPLLSYFHAEYFAPGDLFPVDWSRRFHGLRLPVPHRAWAVLNRTYGSDCAYIARLNEHYDATADMRQQQYEHLRSPAQVRELPWWRS